MSHIVTIATKVRDKAAVDAACRRLAIAPSVVGTARLFAGSIQGLLIQLPGWTYPAVIDLTSGEVKYDNYGGVWGDQAHLDRFMQAYAIEKAKLEARRNGYSVTEQTLQDGCIRLQISEGT